MLTVVRPFEALIALEEITMRASLMPTRLGANETTKLFDELGAIVIGYVSLLDTENSSAFNPSTPTEYTRRSVFPLFLRSIGNWAFM